VIRGVYVISVASRLLDMHPQTLRKYERLGLVQPSRSMGMLRLYSDDDIARLRMIKWLVDHRGMNLAGVELALALVNQVLEMRHRFRQAQETVARRAIEEEALALLQLLNFPSPLDDEELK
jgi:MerR family transcriptional regulator/heat shock protein HspR